MNIQDLIAVMPPSAIADTLDAMFQFPDRMTTRQHMMAGMLVDTLIANVGHEEAEEMVGEEIYHYAERVEA